MAYGYDGFLRWAYDAWPEDADRDARHGSWAAGDCYMVYPGGKSCIRFKKPDQIPFSLIAELAMKMSAEEFVGVYEDMKKR